jgi:hypothetical protein
LLRPPIATERFSILRDGAAAHRTKYGRGSKTHRIMQPMEAMARIAALVPPPRRPTMMWPSCQGHVRRFFLQRAAQSPELWWAEPGKLATCNTGTQELEQGTAAFTAWFRCLTSGVPVFAFEFPCCLLLVVGRLSGLLFFFCSSVRTWAEVVNGVVGMLVSCPDRLSAGWLLLVDDL